MTGLSKVSANIATAERAFRSATKGGSHIRKDVSKLDALKHTAITKDGRSGPRGYGASRSEFDNRIAKQFQNKIMAEGDSTAVLNKNRSNSNMKPLGTTADEKRGLNNSVNLHEVDEKKEFTKRNNPQTSAGKTVGHHSMSKILGRENNRHATASDKVTKAGTNSLAEYRKGSGEKELFDSLALRDKHGKTPYKYGEGNRMNRSQIKAMYRKEVGGQPGRTKAERTQDRKDEMIIGRVQRWLKRNPNVKEPTSQNFGTVPTPKPDNYNKSKAKDMMYYTR